MNKFQYISPGACPFAKHPNGFSKILIWIVDHMGCTLPITAVIIPLHSIGMTGRIERNFFALFVLSTRMHFALVQPVGCCSCFFRLSHCLIGSSDHQLMVQRSCIVMCSRASLSLARACAPSTTSLIILVFRRERFCNYSSHWNNIKMHYWNAINKGSWGRRLW